MKNKGKSKGKGYKEKKFTINFPVFSDYKFLIVFTTDLEKSCVEKGVDHNLSEKAGAITLFSPDSNKVCILLRLDAPVEYIAHESWHGVHQMFEQLGIGLDNEAVAYHVGYISQKITDFQKKVKL